MTKAEEKKRLRKIRKRMRQSLILFLSEADQTQLHQFRVQVKKTKSLLLLLQVNRRNKKLLEVFKPVKKIFRHAGRIRDAYLHLDIAAEFQLMDSEFMQEQQVGMVQESELFREKGKRYLNVVNHTFAKLLKRLKKTDDYKIASFFQSELDAVTLALAKREFDEAMHACRKKIKNLLYNYKLAQSSFGNQVTLNIPYLTEVQEKIGKWHDDVMAWQLIEEKLPETPLALSKMKERVHEDEREIITISENFWHRVRAASV